MNNQTSKINRGVTEDKDEWYTPITYLDLVRDVYGGTIDLDPASNIIAQEGVKATTYWTKEDNSLDKVWQGKVWLNPPYSTKLLNKFIDKAIDELCNVDQLIILINSNTETKYYQKLAEMCDAFCLTNHRIKFINPSNSKANSPVKGNTFFYFGDNLDKFRCIFKHIGVTIVR